MKRLLATGLLLLLIIYGIPLVRQDFFAAQAAEPTAEPTAEPAASDVVDVNEDDRTLNTLLSANIPPDKLRNMNNPTIAVLHDGQVEEMDLEDYVQGVVAAEVSPTFPMEALRAQAVAARTYAVCKMNASRSSAHENADVCDDYHHCAAYIDLPTEAVGRWGDKASSYKNTIQKAVEETAGQIVTYEGKPIVAVFHSASAAKTEAAKDIWGSDVPYLQSVDSPGGELCPKYKTDSAFTTDEFRTIVSKNWSAAKLSGTPGSWCKIETRSQAGAVCTLTLGGVSVKGGDVREAFSLCSSNFTISATAKTITFHATGYGHGVGLSQYGAKYMAEQGKTYEEILKHYYTGTEITHL